MSQQINLLDDTLLPRREWLTLLNVVFGMALVVVLLVAAAGHGWWREAQERSRFAEAETRLRQEQDQLTQLATRQSTWKISPQLEAELAATTQLLARKREVMDVLAHGELGDRNGFSAYMEAFARQGVDGVWLTGFDLTAGKRTFEVRGRMRQESLLPRFVQQLNQETVFQGRRFAALDMRRLDGAKGPNDAPGMATGQPVIEFVLLADPAKPAAEHP